MSESKGAGARTPARLSVVEGGRPWPAYLFTVAPEDLATPEGVYRSKFNNSARQAQTVLKLMWCGGLLSYNALRREYVEQGYSDPGRDGGLRQWLKGQDLGSERLADAAVAVVTLRCIVHLPQGLQVVRTVGVGGLVALRVKDHEVAPTGFWLGEQGTLQVSFTPPSGNWLEQDQKHQEQKLKKAAQLRRRQRQLPGRGDFRGFELG